MAFGMHCFSSDKLHIVFHVIHLIEMSTPMHKTASLLEDYKSALRQPKLCCEVARACYNDASHCLVQRHGAWLNGCR